LLSRGRAVNLRPMHNLVARSPIQDAPPEAKTALSILIAYGEKNAGQRAMRICRGLMRGLKEDYDFGVDLWKFDALQVPTMARIADRNAARADLIVISSDAPNLPYSAKLWIEGIIRKEAGRPRALVALLPDGRDGTAPAHPSHSYLRDAARRGGMEFICEPDGAAAADRADRPMTGPPEGMETPTAILGDALRFPGTTPRWGINE
jgi:hypothetical protein